MTNAYLNGYIAGYMHKEALGPSKEEQAAQQDENQLVAGTITSGIKTAQTPEARQLSAILGGILAGGAGAGIGAIAAGKGKRLKGAGIGAGIGAALGGAGGYFGPAAAAGTAEKFFTNLPDKTVKTLKDKTAPKATLRPG